MVEGVFWDWISACMPSPNPEGTFGTKDNGIALDPSVDEVTGVVGAAPAVEASSLLRWTRGLEKLDAVLVGILEIVGVCDRTGTFDAGVKVDIVCS